MGDIRKGFDLSDEVRRLVSELQHAEEKRLYKYEELSSIAKDDIKKNEKNWIIQSALNILSRDYGLEFENVKGIGYSRITDPEKIKKINGYNRRAFSSARRAVRVSQNTNYEKLSDEEKTQFGMVATMSYFIFGFRKQKNQELLNAIVVDPLRLTDKDVDTASAIILQFGGKKES